MTPGQTRLCIAGGAVLTCALIWFAPGQGEPTVSEPAKSSGTPRLRIAAGRGGAADAAVKPLEQTLKSTRADIDTKDASTLFAKGTWVVIPPVPPPVRMPP
ncbi:hypothetical protein, partial [Actimicrobium sp. CCI2.3]